MIQKLNNWLKSYWLKDPPWGLRRVLFYYLFLLILVTLAYWQKEFLFLLFNLGSIFFLTLFLLISLKNHGYFHRLEEINDSGVDLEIRDFISLNKFQKNKRHLKIKETNLSYGISFLDPLDNKKESAYQDVIRKVFEEWFKADSATENLFLGGGICILPLFISQKYPKTSNQVVELSPQLIKVAKKYSFPLFNFKKTPRNLEIIIKDAQKFVEKKEKKYDFVFQDIFVGTKLPKQFLGKQWLALLLNRLKVGGLLAIHMGTPRAGDSQLFPQVLFVNSFFKTIAFTETLFFKDCFFILVSKKKFDWGEFKKKERMTVSTTGNHSFFLFCKKILREKQKLTIEAEGKSMAPIINQGDKLEIIKLSSSAPKKGTIISFWYNNQLVSHRLIRVAKGGKFQTRGDANYRFDPLISSVVTLGQVEKIIKKNGQVVDLTSRTERVKSFLKISPFFLKSFMEEK